MSSDDTLRLYVVVGPDPVLERADIVAAVSQVIVEQLSLKLLTDDGREAAFSDERASKVCAHIYALSGKGFHFALDEWYWRSTDEQALVVTLIAICRTVRARLARTFGEGGSGFLEPAEHGGNISTVEWFQYFGAGLSERWKQAPLTSPPFERVEWGPEGDLTLLLRFGPKGYDVDERIHAARAMGIVLRLE